jgi:plasmid replication initiation protein
MMNYGFDGDQAQALEVAIASMYVRIKQIEASIRFNKKQISGDTVHTLERGEFLKRHLRMIEEDEKAIEELRKSIKEIQQMLGVPGVTDNS